MARIVLSAEEVKEKLGSLGFSEVVASRWSYSGRKNPYPHVDSCWQRNVSSSTGFRVQLCLPVDMRCIFLRLVWSDGTGTVELAGTTKVNCVTSQASTLKRLQDRTRKLSREAAAWALKPKCSQCGCPLFDGGLCRNFECPTRTGARTGAQTGSSTAKLHQAFGAAHSAVIPATPRPPGVTPKRAVEIQMKEAERYRAEDPVLSRGDMPPELRGLF